MTPPIEDRIAEWRRSLAETMNDIDLDDFDALLADAETELRQLRARVETLRSSVSILKEQLPHVDVLMDLYNEQDKTASLETQLAEVTRERDRLLLDRDHDDAPFWDAAMVAAQAARVDELERALRAIAEDPHQSYDDHGPASSPMDRQYKIGVSDGHRCAAAKARAALEGKR